MPLPAHRDGTQLTLGRSLRAVVRSADKAERLRRECGGDRDPSPPLPPLAQGTSPLPWTPTPSLSGIGTPLVNPSRAWGARLQSEASGGRAAWEASGRTEPVQGPGG